MSAKAWGGVFSEATDPRVERFTESISFDQRLYQHDCWGSIAHARMLADVGVLTPDEAEQIAFHLKEIARQIAKGEFKFLLELEDIHMHVEKALIERIGDVGRKLHTARSRNDQVSTALRLWLRDAVDGVNDLLLDLQKAFLGRCETDFDVVLPAYTHMRRAQPVLAPHYWLAYVEKFERDRQRLADARKRINVMGLGAAALAGTSICIDREITRKRLGFDAIAANSLDVSSDRDFVVETVFVLAMICEHLSTWAEEWILWSGVEFGFISLPQSFCTGSSIMPQKINPDVLELVRGKTGRVIGALTSLLVLIKGLPLAYNRDLQEDKPSLFDAIDTVTACLQLAAPLVTGAVLMRDRVHAQIELGHLDATTLMEQLIVRGVPQRAAHEVVGKLVRLALEKGCPLQDLSDSELASVYPQYDARLKDCLGATNAVRFFVSHGSTAPDQVRSQIQAWTQKLQATSSPAAAVPPKPGLLLHSLETA